MTDTEPQYEIVNKQTGTVEAGPYPYDEAKDRLRETRAKLKEQANSTPIYVPIRLRLRKAHDRASNES